MYFDVEKFPRGMDSHIKFSAEDKHKGAFMPQVFHLRWEKLRTLGSLAPGLLHLKLERPEKVDGIAYSIAAIAELLLCQSVTS